MTNKRIAGIAHLADGKFYIGVVRADGYESGTFPDDEMPREIGSDALAQQVNNSGLDLLYLYDHAETDGEREINLHALKDFTRVLEVPLCAGGYISRLEDVKKFLYAGASSVMIHGTTENAVDLCSEAALRFGNEKINVGLRDLDFLAKAEGKFVPNTYIVLNRSILKNKDIYLNAPYMISLTDESNFPPHLVEIYLKLENSYGVFSGEFLRDDFDVKGLKSELSLPSGRFLANIAWDELVKNDKGLIPVVVQDHITDEVLMVAYMNEEAYNATIRDGRMTYFSRSRNELWLKGATSGHFQYLKSLYADCDKDTLLAKVSQVGAACHTGNKSCFFNSIIDGPPDGKNPRRVLEDVYDTIMDRKANPKEGSYTNYLFDKGIDKILKKLGEEATEIVIASKNPEPEEIKYEISDFLYHCMVLMAEKGITWADIAEEMAGR